MLASRKICESLAHLYIRYIGRLPSPQKLQGRLKWGYGVSSHSYNLLFLLDYKC